jgi:hypothetical protein
MLKALFMMGIVKPSLGKKKQYYGYTRRRAFDQVEMSRAIVFQEKTDLPDFMDFINKTIKQTGLQDLETNPQEDLS